MKAALICLFALVLNSVPSSQANDEKLSTQLHDEMSRAQELGIGQLIKENETSVFKISAGLVGVGGVMIGIGAMTFEATTGILSWLTMHGIAGYNYTAYLLVGGGTLAAIGVAGLATVFFLSSATYTFDYQIEKNPAILFDIYKHDPQRAEMFATRNPQTKASVEEYIESLRTLSDAVECAIEEGQQIASK